MCLRQSSKWAPQTLREASTSNNITRKCKTQRNSSTEEIDLELTGNANFWMDLYAVRYSRDNVKPPQRSYNWMVPWCGIFKWTAVIQQFYPKHFTICLSVSSSHKSLTHGRTRRGASQSIKSNCGLVSFSMTPWQQVRRHYVGSINPQHGSKKDLLYSTCFTHSTLLLHRISKLGRIFNRIYFRTSSCSHRPDQSCNITVHNWGAVNHLNNVPPVFKLASVGSSLMSSCVHWEAV